MPVLTGVDLLRIQQYVFGSNRLRDVLAASYAIEQVTDREKGLKLPKSNVILAAGGNALLTFETLEAARQWTASFTRRLHDELAPDLEAAIVHREYQPGKLAEALLQLQRDLARHKLERAPTVPQLGLSVTATCAWTGAPATGKDEEDQLVSRRIIRLRSLVPCVIRRWNKYLPELCPRASGWRAKFPLDLDDLGRTHGEASLIGVVHVDGNGVGGLITSWLQRRIGTADDQVGNEAKEWSSDLKELGEAALRAMIARVAACVVLDARDGPYLTGQPARLQFALSTPEVGLLYLPLRPIVLGGDDMTFVCDARIALDLAATALHAFEQQQVRHLGEDGSPAKVTACAGVAIVRSHAPFFRAYEAARKLCASAKKARREALRNHGSAGGSWMDWMIGLGRPFQSLEEAREAYRSGAYLLTMRPYPVTAATRRETWGWLDEELLGPGCGGKKVGFRGHDDWRESRNRVKQLEALARSGPDEVRRQMAVWSATAPSLKMPGDLQDGFVGSATPLLDAVELMDLHLRLEPPGETKEDQ